MEPDIILDATNPQQARARQVTQQEMARRSQDRIRVYNPTNEDYTVRFDGIGFVIPNRNKDNGHGLGVAVVLRYVAENYMTQMTDLILTTKLDDAIRLENERRASLGMLPMTKFIGGEELMFTQSLRTDNKEARDNLRPILILGLAERYGTETSGNSQLEKPRDDRTPDQIAFDNLSNKTSVMPQEAPKEEVSSTTTSTNTPPISGTLDELKNKDVFTLRKMAKEKGIETEKTDKKDALIAKISQ